MGEQKQNDHRPKKGGEKKQNQPEKPRMSEAAKAAAELKHLRNVKHHLAQDAKRAQKAESANVPHGTARLERRRLARLAVVEAAGQASQPPTTKVAEGAGLFPERE